MPYTKKEEKKSMGERKGRKSPPGKKTINKLTVWSSYVAMGVWPAEINSAHRSAIHVLMFIVELFAKSQKVGSASMPLSRWLYKRGGIYKQRNVSSCTEEEWNPTISSKQMQLKGFLLSEMGELQKCKYHMIAPSLLCMQTEKSTLKQKSNYCRSLEQRGGGI